MMLNDSVTREKRRRKKMKKFLAETRRKGVVRRRNLKVPKPSSTIHQVLHTQKLFRVNLLHLAIHVMQEHVRHTGFLPVARHHSGGEHRRHPPRRLREVPLRRVDHDHVPLRLVNLVGEILQRQLARLVATKVRRRRRTRGFGAVRGEQRIGVAKLRTVTDRMSPQARRVFQDRMDPLRILLEEHRGATRVERGPHEGIVAQPEDKEVAWPAQ
ncbi:hypothetical protein V8G54_021577 [Vigna mungo]|uniref:Uncharacterized protein n=1 Tax=Vigna mungo TaxID=3915 RepID=A0AAQ3NEF7_VIGMU